MVKWLWNKYDDSINPALYLHFPRFSLLWYNYYLLNRAASFLCGHSFGRPPPVLDIQQKSFSAVSIVITEKDGKIFVFTQWEWGLKVGIWLLNTLMFAIPTHSHKAKRARGKYQLFITIPLSDFLRHWAMSVALDSSDLLKWKGTDVKQESIPVGCVPPALYRTGGLPYRDPPTPGQKLRLRAVITIFTKTDTHFNSSRCQCRFRSLRKNHNTCNYLTFRYR